MLIFDRATFEDWSTDALGKMYMNLYEHYHDQLHTRGEFEAICDVLLSDDRTEEELWAAHDVMKGYEAQCSDRGYHETAEVLRAMAHHFYVNVIEPRTGHDNS